MRALLERIHLVRALSAFSTRWTGKLAACAQNHAGYYTLVVLYPVRMTFAAENIIVCMVGDLKKFGILSACVGNDLDGYPEI